MTSTRRPLLHKAASLFSSLFQFYSENNLKQQLRKFRNFNGTHDFTSRQRSRKNLLLVVAGHKPALWPLVFPRIETFTPADWDVCLCLPGVKSDELAALAAKQGWSVLHTMANRLALAQNLAISRHPEARCIVKMDEDIFLAKGTLAGLVASLDQYGGSLTHFPGIVCPLLNVNGFCARLVLKRLGCLEEFEARFGPCIPSCLETPAWQNPEAARFLWEILMPFDAFAARFAATPPEFSACPHRFSIGCFAILRDFWESMQGFTVGPSGDLGVEEIDLAAHCAAVSRPILVAHHLLAGHAGFGHQMPVMEPWLIQHPGVVLKDAERNGA